MMTPMARSMTFPLRANFSFVLADIHADAARREDRRWSVMPGGYGAPAPLAMPATFCFPRDMRDNAGHTGTQEPAEMNEQARIGIVTVSDRASRGEYQDQGGPAIEDWLRHALAMPWQPVSRLVPDEQPAIEQALKELCDREGCCLVVTTGGTGPAPRDVTPEATLAIADKVLDGFGEQMRAVSLKYVPTAILSRQVGVVRGKSLVINLPGQPKAIKETLDGVFAAVPYCIDLIGGPYLETRAEIVKAFRPKSALRPKPAG
jgi:molybdopterin adenylyltransferase